MKINNKKLEEYNKDIHKVCLENGELFPFLIDDNLSDEHYLTYDEVKQIRKDMPIKTLRQMDNKRIATYKQRKLELHQIYTKKHDKYKTVEEFIAKEMITFIDKYPQFKDVVEDKSNINTIEYID